VVFKPTAIGTRTGSLVITTNDTKYPIITVALTGNGVDFSLSITPSSGTTVAGYTVAPNLSVTPLGGFSAPIILACTTDASGSTCTPQTTSTTLDTTTVMPLTITTTSQYTVIGYSGFGGAKHPWLFLWSVVSAGLIFFSIRKSGFVPRLTLVLGLLVFLAVANLGCSSKSPDTNSSPTLPGTYTYTVIATDGTLTRTATYSLNVTVRE